MFEAAIHHSKQAERPPGGAAANEQKDQAHEDSPPGPRSCWWCSPPWRAETETPGPAVETETQRRPSLFSTDVLEEGWGGASDLDDVVGGVFVIGGHVQPNQDALAVLVPHVRQRLQEAPLPRRPRVLPPEPVSHHRPAELGLLQRFQHGLRVQPLQHSWNRTGVVRPRHGPNMDADPGHSLSFMQDRYRILAFLTASSSAGSDGASNSSGGRQQHIPQHEQASSPLTLGHMGTDAVPEFRGGFLLLNTAATLGRAQVRANMSRHTFETEVHFLAQPRVDAIGRGILGDGVVLDPPAAGEAVEVVAGVDGLVDLTEDGSSWKETESPVSGGKGPGGSRPGPRPHLLRCILGSGRTPPGWIFGKLEEGRQKSREGL